MGRVMTLVVVVALSIAGLGVGQGVADDDLAPLPSMRSLLDGQARRLGQRLASEPSSLTRDVFRAYRAWLAQLARHGLEDAFRDDVRALSERMAERIAGRYEELVAECREGNVSVVSQMRDLFTWAERYPALVQRLGAEWFTLARAEYDRCGLPEWRGTVNAGQLDAFAEGYFGTVDVTWRLADVVDGFEATYVPDVDFVSFEIPPGECERFDVERATPNLAGSFLVVDFLLEPPMYRGVLFIDVAVTIVDTCDRTTPPFRMTFPMPIMFPDDLGWHVATREVIAGDYADEGTAYRSAWHFDAVERGATDAR